MTIDKRKWSLICMLLLFILGICSFALFRYANMWLVINDPVPQHIDVLFTFAGATERIQYTEELFRKHPEATWVLSGRNRESLYAGFVKNGTDTAKIVLIDTCTSTWAEVGYLKQWLLSNTGNTPLTIGLVSSPYHMHRIKFMVNRRFSESKMRFYCLPTNLNTNYCNVNTMKSWWNINDLRRIVALEVVKNAYALFLLWP